MTVDIEARARTSRQNRAAAKAAKKKAAEAKRAAATARKVAKLEAALAKIRLGTPPRVDLNTLDLFEIAIDQGV